LLPSTPERKLDTDSKGASRQKLSIHWTLRRNVSVKSLAVLVSRDRYRAGRQGALGTTSPASSKELREARGIACENPADHTALSDAREVKLIWDARVRDELGGVDRMRSPSAPSRNPRPPRAATPKLSVRPNQGHTRRSRPWHRRRSRVRWRPSRHGCRRPTIPLGGTTWLLNQQWPKRRLRPQAAA